MSMGPMPKNIKNYDKWMKAEIKERKKLLKNKVNNG